MPNRDFLQFGLASSLSDGRLVFLFGLLVFFFPSVGSHRTLREFLVDVLFLLCDISSLFFSSRLESCPFFFEKHFSAFSRDSFLDVCPWARALLLVVRGSD